jgi:hypothetical protein
VSAFCLFISARAISVLSGLSTHSRPLRCLINFVRSTASTAASVYASARYASLPAHMPSLSHPSSDSRNRCPAERQTAQRVVISYHDYVVGAGGATAGRVGPPRCPVCDASRRPSIAQRHEPEGLAQRLARARTLSQACCAENRPIVTGPSYGCSRRVPHRHCHYAVLASSNVVPPADLALRRNSKSICVTDLLIVSAPVGRLPHAHMSAVATDVVHPVRDHAALGIIWEVVSVDLFRRVAPSGSVVGEVAHEFFVFTVDAQHRAAMFQSQAPPSRQVVCRGRSGGDWSSNDRGISAQSYPHAKPVRFQIRFTFQT